MTHKVDIEILYRTLKVIRNNLLIGVTILQVTSDSMLFRKTYRIHSCLKHSSLWPDTEKPSLKLIREFTLGEITEQVNSEGFFLLVRAD